MQSPCAPAGGAGWFDPMRGSWYPKRMNFHIQRDVGTTKVTMQGDIVAGVGKDLFDLMANLKDKQVVLDMGGVRQINSVGAGEWAVAIRKLTDNFIVEFVHCPVPFIDYCNMIPSMLGEVGASTSVLIRSFYAPYACPSCRQDFRHLIELDAVIKTRNLPEAPCMKCGGKAACEMMSEDYLMFLSRTF
jgi:hypothetical protein